MSEGSDTVPRATTQGIRPRQGRSEPSDSTTARGSSADGNAFLLDGVNPSNCDRSAATPIALSIGFHAALQSWVEQGVATLSAPSWARVLPALLELRAHSPEMAAVLNNDFDAKLHLIASILELGAAEGRVPAGLDPRLVTQTLIGPLVLAALSGDDHLPELAAYVVDRFLGSYRS